MSTIQGISATNFIANTQKADDTKGRERFLTDAAEVLGMTLEELQEELDSGTTLEEIIEAKGLTKDEFKEKMDELRDKSGAAPPPPPPKEGASDQFLTDAANILGITSDELKTQLESGKDLQTIVTDSGFDWDEFMEQMVEAFNSRYSSSTDSVGNMVDETA